MNNKKDNYKSQSLKDIIVSFAEAMPGCTGCPLDEFCNRSEERKRYVTCAQAAAGWLKTYTDDVREIVHGAWKSFPDCGVTRCTVCDWSIEEAWWSNYCPNCGAKMDL